MKQGKLARLCVMALLGAVFVAAGVYVASVGTHGSPTLPVGLVRLHRVTSTVPTIGNSPLWWHLLVWVALATVWACIALALLKARQGRTDLRSAPRSGRINPV